MPASRIRILVPWVHADESPAQPPNGDQRPSELLLVGVSGPHKRFDLAIRTLAVLRQRGMGLDLTVAGFQTPSEGARLLALARDVGVGSEVVLLGHVKPGELSALYARSITLALSTLEGFGLTPVEAILSGGRVAAVDIPAYRDTVGEVAVFAEEATPEAVAGAVEAALATPPDPVRVTALGDRFSARACATSLRAAYEAALG